MLARRLQSLTSGTIRHRYRAIHDVTGKPTRPSLLASKGKKPLTLDQYLQRSKVISMYREIMRTTKRISDVDTKLEMRRWARTEFESQRMVEDATTIRYLIAKGRTQFDGMRRYVEDQAG